MAQSSKHIVLTGVSRGCGFAMAESFIQQGHTVSGCCRSAESAAALSNRFSKPNQFHAVDVADDDQVTSWAKAVLSNAAPPDLLINNAALMNHLAPLWKVPSEELSTIIDVNIKGVVNVIRHFVPAMVARGTGVIVNFSSGWGRSTSPEVAPYCATKYAVEGLSLAMARELPKGMACIPLNPGVINTEMLQLCWGDEASTYPTPESWAKRAVPFILSLGPRYNGQSLSVPS
jgi:NAD(P)-dependent dehydrogenase (short-subunit alcohol dehydrogenase family)